MAPTEPDVDGSTEPAVPHSEPVAKKLMGTSNQEVDDWANNVDEVSQQIRDILDGTITDFEKFDHDLQLKQRAKEIREEETKERRNRIILYGQEGKGEGKNYKWWCKRCFVEYHVDLEENKCTRCKQSDKMMTQQQRRDELMGKLDDFKEVKVRHQFRKDKWLRWKKSQAMLKRSRNINYKAWEYWEPDTDSDEEGDPIVPRDNPEFAAMEADMKARHKKTFERNRTADKCRERGNQCMKENDFVGAIEHYEDGLSYRRDTKAIWTNKALAELKVFRWHDAIASCNKVIEYAEIFEDGFTKSADACFKAFMRRAAALRALQKWDEALEDLEDAVKIFPKDKEARNLCEKTRAAAEEAKRAKHLQETDGNASDRGESPSATAGYAEDAAPEAPEAVSPPESQVQSNGPVRVEIEESDEEDDIPQEANPDSLAGLSKQSFSKLVQRLKGKASERTLFCSRKGGESVAYAKKDEKKRDKEGRKVVMKIEEVPEASGLDNLLKDVERCCVLWKKHQGHVLPLRKDIDRMDPYDAAELREASNFLEVTVPRALEVLHTLASNSDLHCELTASAVRYVWPLLSSSAWRHRVLELLMEWSQCSVSAKVVAEFASRYPEPHLRMLVDAMTREEKENLLPPGFEDIARSATERLEHGEQGIDAAMDDMLRGLSSLSAAELAVSTVGNICVAGQALPTFKEQIAPFRDDIISALARQLRPLDWRLCGRAAGTLANVLRCGSGFVDAVQEQCLEPLVKALREESADQGPMSMLRTLGAGSGKSRLPFVKATARLLGALQNFLVIRPTGLKQLQELGLLEIVVPLIEGAGETDAGRIDSVDDDPATIASRAITLASKLVKGAPDSISLKLESDILRRVDRILEHECRRPSSSDALERLDLALRILIALVTKKEGALDRLIAKVARVEELPEGASSLADLEPAIPFGKVVSRLMKLMSSLKLRDHVPADEEGGTSSRIRGNLALLFARLIEEQASGESPPILRDMNFETTVDVFIDWLRKERGPTQQNIGVSITRLAQHPKYRQRVRDLNGIESLHQIMLPQVEAQKAEASRQHRSQNESKRLTFPAP